MINDLVYRWFLLTVFFIHFSSVPFWLNAFSACFFFLFLVFYLIGAVKFKKTGFKKVGLELPFVGYLLAAFISVFDAYIIEWSIGKVISIFLSIILFYILFSSLDSKNRYKKFIEIVFYGGLVLIVCGFYQYLLFVLKENVGIYLPFLRFILEEARVLPRISSLFLVRSGTNVYACYLALFAPIIWVVFLKKHITYFWKILISIILLLNILLTYSRALYLSFLIVFLIYAFLNSKYKQYLLSSVLIIFALLFFFFQPVNKTVVSMFNMQDSSNIEHLQTLHSAFLLIKEHPLNGWGADHVSRKIQQTKNGWVDGHGYKMNIPSRGWTPDKFYKLREQARKDGVISIDSPHNIYLWNFIDTGLIGFMAFLYLLGAIYKKLLKLAGNKSKNKDLARAMLFGYSAFLFYGLFQDSLNAPIMTLFFWIFILAVCGLERFSKEKIL